MKKSLEFYLAFAGRRHTENGGPATGNAKKYEITEYYQIDKTTLQGNNYRNFYGID